MTRLIPLLIFTAVLSGCANPINQRTATTYYQSGETALNQGNLVRAKEMFSRALINVRLGYLGAEAEAQVLMKLGQTMGNLCEYKEAENAFLKAESLYMDVYGKDSPATISAKLEVAQLSYDIGWYTKAVTYFNDALEAGGTKLKESDPIMYYDILVDYRDALLKTGNTQKAGELGKEIELKPSDLNKGSGYVRYPTECK